MDNTNSSSSPQSFGETYKSIWIDLGQTKFNRTIFENLTNLTNKAVSPLKPLLGLFSFTAYDESALWSDNSERFFDAWKNLVTESYPENICEIPLLFTGFAMSFRLGFKRKSWGVFLTDSAAYASVSLYGDKATRRYAYPALQDISPGWASAFARQIVDDFDPEGIAAFAKLTREVSSFDEGDNPEKIILGSTSDPKHMSELMIACFTLVLDAFIGVRETLTEGHEEQNADTVISEPIPLTVRVIELGLGDSIKLGSDPGHAKHFKKLANKLGIDADEKIIFSLSDSTFAGVYGLAVTDRAIRSRDLMEDAVTQPLIYGDIAREKYSLVIGGGPVHAVGEFIPERLMPSVVTLLEEYLSGKILLI